ncbi:MAG: aspartate kinase [Chloroflexi bacterium]|nr:aspartate kinase [Chloroflexota bacterium]
MALIVQKYGGTSVGDAQRIKAVADRIIARIKGGDRLVVVVSAMGQTTDELIALAAEMTDEPEAREMDLLLSTGEIVTSTLLAMALKHSGQSALALSGAQAGIATDQVYGRARILKLDPARVVRELDAGAVVIVAGFQGVTEELEIATLGRGGSDTTAVALAAALKAERCEIYTDVDGVYTADPRICPEASKLSEVGYEEMLELSTWGARVMHNRAIELAAVYRVPVYVSSSFNDEPGTLIHGGVAMEKANKVMGIAHDEDVARITVRGVPDRPGIAAHIFEPLGKGGISVDTIVQNASVERLTDLTFTVSRSQLDEAMAIIKPIGEEIEAGEVMADTHLAKVSIVGAGMTSGPGYAGRMFRTLFEAKINIELITTSEIRITCLIDEKDVPAAVKALHRAFELADAA